MTLYQTITHRVVVLLICSATALGLFSCGKDESSPKPTGPVPVITRFTPSEGQAGIPVTIAGANFGTNRTTVVYFSGPNNTYLPAAVNGTGFLDGQEIIYTSVPAGAVTGKIKVEMNGQAGESTTPFTILTPVADLTISPTSGAVGSTVVLTGITFSTTAADNRVTFAGTGSRHSAVVTEAGPNGSYIVVRVPGGVTDGPVQVTIGASTSTVHASTVSFRARPCNVTTFAGGSDGYADGTGVTARFAGTGGTAIIANTMYIADAGNHRIRKIDLSSGAVTTFAGADAGFADGTGTSARFNHPAGLVTGADGKLYVNDYGNNRIRSIDPVTATVVTIAGNGTAGTVDGIGANARLSALSDIAAAADGMLYFTQNSDSHAVRQLNPATGQVTTLAGGTGAGLVDGPGSTAKFFFPAGLVAINGALYIADSANEVIRRINLADNTVSTLAGGTPTTFASTDGLGRNSGFNEPLGLATDGTYLYVTDRNVVRRIDLASTAVSTMAGVMTISFSPVNGDCKDAQFAHLGSIAIVPNGTIYLTESSGFSTDLSLIRRIIP